MDEQSRLRAEQTLDASPPFQEPVEHELQVYQIELEMQNENLRQAQVAQEESRNRYVDLYEFAPVAYLTLSEVGTIAAANLTAAAMLGVDRQKLLEQRFDLHVAEADRERWRRQFLANLAQPGRKQQTTLMLQGGNAIHCLAQLDCVRVEDAGGQVFLHVTLNDIGERESAARQVRDSHALNAAVLNSVPAALAVLDRDGSIIAVNQAWRRFAQENAGAGVTKTEVGNNYLAACVSAAGDSTQEGFAAYQGIRAVMEGKQPSFTLEYPCHAPWQARWFRMSVTPLDLPAGGVVVAHHEISESKAAEQAVRDSERKYSVMFDEASLPAVLASFPGGVVFDVNKSWTRLFGFTPDEVQGKTSLELGINRDMQRRADLVTVLQRRQSVHDLEQTLYAKSGAAITVLSNLDVMQINGQDYVLTSIQDISERRAAEVQLAQREQDLRMAVEGASLGTWRRDVDSDLIVVSARTRELLGFGPDESVEVSSVLERIHPDDRARVQAAIAESVSRSTPYQGECRVLRPDGSQIWIAAGGRTFSTGRSGQVPHFSGVLMDITEQKRTLAALREKEAQYRAVIETAADGIWVVDQSGHLVVVNAAYIRRSGYGREELLSMHIADLEAEESPEEVRAHMEKIRRHGSDLFETRHRAKDGEIWPVELNVSFSAEAGDLRYVFLRDISERKRSEAHLQTLTVEMEQIMRHHVARQTVAAIAHELNQPLNAIASYSDAALHLLRSGNPKPERLLHALESASQQAQRAGSVVRELLNFVRHGKFETEAVSLNDLVRMAVNRIGADRIGPVQIRLELEPDLAPVRANPMQMEKVLDNLIQNGIEAMLTDGVQRRDITVTVRTHGDGKVAQVSVRDSGPGIDAQVLHRVFDPFYTTKLNGLGIGLAISRDIVEAHGGELWAESEPGSGSAFHFTLPFMS